LEKFYSSFKYSRLAENSHISLYIGPGFFIYPSYFLIFLGLKKIPSSPWAEPYIKEELRYFFILLSYFLHISSYFRSYFFIFFHIISFIIPLYFFICSSYFFISLHLEKFYSSFKYSRLAENSHISLYIGPGFFIYPSYFLIFLALRKFPSFCLLQIQPVGAFHISAYILLY